MKNWDLGDHVVVVIVSQCAGQLLVVHRRLVLALAPHLRHRLGAVQLELAVHRHPLDDLAVLMIGEQLQQKLPKLDLSIVACEFHKKSLLITLHHEIYIVPSLQINRTGVHYNVSWWDKKKIKRQTKPHSHRTNVKGFSKQMRFEWIARVVRVNGANTRSIFDTHLQF